MADRMAAIQQRLIELEDSHTDRFDPVGFAYIKALIQRAVKLGEPVFHRLESKVHTALTDYLDRFHQAQSNAGKIIERLLLTHPDLENTLRFLYTENNFQQIKNLESKQKSRKIHLTLKKLVEHTHHLEDGFSLDNQHLPLKERLQIQEAEVLRSLGDSSPESLSNGNKKPLELLSYRLFKESWNSRHSAALVSRAIKERPENAGHLNTQMLAIRTLATMRELAPKYLDSFVSYLDTLFWLENMGNQ